MASHPQKEPAGDERIREADGKITPLLEAEGHLSSDQLRYARRVAAKLATPRPLLAIVQELGYVTEEQVSETLRGNRLGIRLGDLLLELDLLSESDLKTAIALQLDSPGKKLGEVLIENHFISEDELLNVVSYQLGFPFIAQDLLDIDLDVAGRTSVHWFETHKCVPACNEEGLTFLVFTDPLSAPSVEEIAAELGTSVDIGIARHSAVAAGLTKLGKRTHKVADTEVESQVVRTVNELIEHAIREGASDIHIEPLKDRLRVRLRQDGVLIPHTEIPQDLARGLTSRIKIMAGADIAERRRHQDGRILYEHEGMPVDIRVSFYATIHGEKIALRLLNVRSELLDIDDLCMQPRMLTRFREEVLDVPSGVVLVTGPTGSGKTTSLYAAINHLNNINTSIITAEDPVEYVIPGINQCSINAKINLTYEETLRHIVRQDPDVIVIGEIRDKFSAETAIQAALTGHKVLTTFHTEDSIGGLLRLLHMDIEAFLISSTVVCVVAQRLLRRVCPQCAEEHVLTPDEVRRLGYNPADTPRMVFQRGRGCGNCRQLGYRGRIAIFELLVLNELVRDALLQRRTSYEIRRISAESTGLVTLAEDGILKAVQGRTSWEEVVHKLPRLEDPRPLSEIRRLHGVHAS